MSLNTTLIGPANPSPPTIVDITVEPAVQGSFVVNKGTPTLLPISGLAATTFNPVLLLTGSIYQSNLDFISSIARNSNSPVATLFGSAVSLLGGGESNDYAGASAKILAAELDNLHAVLSLTFPLFVSVNRAG